MTKKKSRRPVPLTAPPTSSAMRSRKRARRATTLFHNFTRERDAAVKRGDDISIIEKWDEKIRAMGGREEYQRASQLNTSLFSTSKWVLGVLGKWGWLHGLPLEECDGGDTEEKDRGKEQESTDVYGKCIGEEVSPNKIVGDAEEAAERRKLELKRKRVERRDVRLLEIGAINMQLLDAASRKEKGKSGLNVRAIDLRSTHSRIEEADFLQMRLDLPFDVIVCSMVINCITTPGDRGKMLCLLYHQLRPGGVCFLTLPRLCLIQSKYMTVPLFGEILGKDGVGFEVLETKDSPKVAFFVLQRPKEDQQDIRLDDRFARAPVIKRGSKFRNMFAVTLTTNEVVGSAFLQSDFAEGRSKNTKS